MVRIESVSSGCAFEGLLFDLKRSRRAICDFGGLPDCQVAIRYGDRAVSRSCDVISSTSTTDAVFFVEWSLSSGAIVELHSSVVGCGRRTDIRSDDVVNVEPSYDPHLCLIFFALRFLNTTPPVGTTSSRFTSASTAGASSPM